MGAQLGLGVALYSQGSDQDDRLCCVLAAEGDSPPHLRPRMVLCAVAPDQREGLWVPRQALERTFRQVRQRGAWQLVPGRALARACQPRGQEGRTSILKGIWEVTGRAGLAAATNSLGSGVPAAPSSDWKVRPCGGKGTWGPSHISVVKSSHLEVGGGEWRCFDLKKEVNGGEPNEARPLRREEPAAGAAEGVGRPCARAGHAKTGESLRVR